MKNICLGLLLVLALASCSHAVELVLEWDPPISGPTPEKYLIYMASGGGQYSFAGEAPYGINTITLDLAPGVYSFYATSYAKPWGESGPSNVVTTPEPVQPPRNMSFGIVVAIIAIPLVGILIGLFIRRR